MTIRTRFAPSPTGMLHIGGVRTALFSWLYARRHGGTFILRIEDTDRERSTDEATQVILDGMEWLGLSGRRGAVLPDAAHGSISRGASSSSCRPATRITATARRKSSRRCAAGRSPPSRSRATTARAGIARRRAPASIRWCASRNPLDGAVVVEDVIHGNVAFDNTELDDLIIARSDGSPTYNFCVVVDDMDMKVTHVIRGDDHLNNTPRQINMLRALGATPPVYAHVPMILGADGAKLSKRHGAVSVLQYREEGFLPEALLNYLVRLGWSHGDQEVFSIEEMTQLFDINDVNKSASAFNPDKLLWLNQQHIMRATPERLALYLKPQLAALGVDVDDDVQAGCRREGAAGARQDAEGDGAEQRVLLQRTSTATTRRRRRRI